MGFFDKAKDNYEKRQKIAEWNYQAREYISDGQRIYEDAYAELVLACSKVSSKVNDFVRYKQQVLNEMNSTLKKIDSSAKEFNISMQVDMFDFDRCAVRQVEQLDCVDKALATWVMPSVSDLFSSVSTEDYYEAKSNMTRAKLYKSQMKAKREELRSAKYAMQSIPDFLSDEKSQIEQLMDKFRKTASSMSLSDNKRAESLCTIAKLIADSLSTQLLDNNCQITAQYNEIHNRISATNNSLSDCERLID